MQAELIEISGRPFIRFHSDLGRISSVQELSDKQLKAIEAIVREESKLPVSKWELFFQKNFRKGKGFVVAGEVWRLLKAHDFRSTHDSKAFRLWVEANRGVKVRLVHGGNRVYEGMVPK